MAINVSQPFHRTSAGPIDDSLNLSKAQMLTVNDNLMPSKWFTVCADDGQFYLYDKSNESDEETGKFRLYQSGKTYSSGDGIDVDNENAEISVDEMPAEDMGEIVTPLPSIKRPYDVYSTKEQRIGFWIDGKPLYQKTIVDTMPVISEDGTVASKDISIDLNIDKLVEIKGIANNQISINCFWETGNGNTYHIRTSVDPNKIYIECDRLTMAEVPVYITIQYTKTTDTPEPTYISIPVD